MITEAHIDENHVRIVKSDFDTSGDKNICAVAIPPKLGASIPAALSKNPVISADLFDSCNSFIRVIRDKISIMRSRMATNYANYANLVATKSRVFSLNNSIVPHASVLWIHR